MTSWKYLPIVVFLLLAAGGEARSQWNKIAQLDQFITASYFFDANTGLVGVADGANPLWRTTDGGLTWSAVQAMALQNPSWINDIWFKDALEGWVAFQPNSTQRNCLCHSTDGGLTWKPVNLPGLLPSVRGTSHAIIVTNSSGAQPDLYLSTDGGSTFSGFNRGLSTTCGADFVDDLHGACGSFGTYFSVSRNGGVSWGLASQNLQNESWGVFGIKGSRVFVAAAEERGGNPNQHIYRSTDFGDNWSEVLRPPTKITGGIAGDHGIIYYQAWDALYRSLDSGITWTNVGGPVDSVLDTRFSVIDCTIYAFDHSGGIFKSTNAGDAGGQLSLGTSDQKADTIGGIVNVPIQVNQISSGQGFDIVMHYTGDVEYLGSFDAANAMLDIAGQQWQGRSKLHVANATSGAVAGYSEFKVYADSVGKPLVTFDSTMGGSMGNACTSVMPPFTCTITPPSGCTIGMISNFVHTGRLPILSIRPNPTTGDVMLSCSDDLGDTRIAIYDMLGAKRADQIVTLQSNSPVRISLPDADGVYTVHVTTLSETRDVRVIRQR